MRTFSNFCFCFFCHFLILKNGLLTAQSLAPTLLTPAGNLETGSDGSISWSLGEIAVLHETAADGKWLTQGFQQPDSARMDTSTMVKTTSKVLTPNGSMGQNDDFEPLLDASIADFQSAELQVFNRWGERVHFENSASPRWDGKSPGGTVFPEGAYFYVLTVTKTDGSKYVHEKGALNILWAH